MAIGDANGCDGPVAIVGDVVFEEGRKSVVGLDAVECAVYVWGYGSCELEIEDVAFESGGFVHGVEDAGFGEADFGGVGEAVGGVVWRDVDLGGQFEDVCHFGGCVYR